MAVGNIYIKIQECQSFVFDQSVIRMSKTNNEGTILTPKGGKTVWHILVLYRTETVDARMLMLLSVFSMLMSSYGDNL
jgi:hypothetical protein